MKLDEKRRESMFNKAKAIHSSLGDIFQNEYELTSGMIDREFDAIIGVELELVLYKRRLNEIKDSLKGES